MAQPECGFADFVFDFLAQFGGGRGDIQNELVRFGLASVFWSVMIFFAWSKRQEQPSLRDKWLFLGFSVALFGELFMLGIYGSIIIGIVSETKLHPYFPPFEHALSQGAIVVISSAFLGYMLQNLKLARQYFTVGISLTVILISTAQEPVYVRIYSQRHRAPWCIGRWCLFYPKAIFSERTDQGNSEGA